MKTIKLGMVGIGPRGRMLLEMVPSFEGVEVVAGCDIRPHNWYDKQWRASMPMADMFPNAHFYEDYDRML